MMRGKPLKRSRKAASGAEIAAHARFRQEVLRDQCVWKGSRAGHQCSGPLDPHHILPKQFLKFHFMPVKKTDPERFWGIVHDPRLGVALCRSAHERVTVQVSDADYLYFGELPARVFEAAREHDLEWRLEVECRPGVFLG